MFNDNLSTDCKKVMKVRTPHGIIVLEQFEGLVDVAFKIEQLAYNKLYKISTDQPCKQCSYDIVDVEYPEYFNTLRLSYIKIYNSLLRIQNILEGVEL